MPAPSYKPGACPHCSTTAQPEQYDQHSHKLYALYCCAGCGCWWEIRYELADDFLYVLEEPEGGAE